MASYDYDIGIIGGGAAGLTVASGAAQLGAKTLLVEKEKELGGDCLHFGCVPSKTLIRTARTYHAMKNSRAFGLPPVEVPPIDFSQVRERIQSVIVAIQQHDSEERFCSLGAKVAFGEPAFADEHSIRLNGQTISAKAWVIATGSSPDIPRIDGLDRTPHITNKEIFSLDRLPESMVILGAGPIATEMAQAFGRLGTKVTVVQRSGQILSREDKDMADEIMQVLTAEGVTFHLNASVLDVNDLGSEREVRFKDKEGTTASVKAERILVAMGRDPNVKGLNLEGIGVEFDRKGIQLKEILSPGDIVIDGGNSYFKDNIRRAESLAEKEIRFMDVGVSGGIWGLKFGYCLMIGGPMETCQYLEPVFKSLAPKHGYLYYGPAGAGHFVKMVHNGIEYGMMQAYGEGFQILEASPYAGSLNYAEVAHLWNQGSVVRSWLLELAEVAFSKDGKLNDIRGYVEDSGEGRWTVHQAIETGVSAPVITLSLMNRFRSRDTDSFSDRVVAALRREFGGHAVVTSENK